MINESMNDGRRDKKLSIIILLFFPLENDFKVMMIFPSLGGKGIQRMDDLGHIVMIMHDDDDVGRPLSGF